MRVVSAEEIDAVLDFPSLVGALRRTFVSENGAPARHHHHVGPEGGRHATYLLMPAWTAGTPGPGACLGTKIVSVFPDNGRLALPAVLGVYVLQSGETGAPLAVLDGTRLTHWRTAAASALAADHLARPDAERLVLVGAGALAPFLVRAHASMRQIRHVAVWNRRPEGAERLATQLADEGFTAEPVTDLARAVRAADIVSCATLSNSPLVEGAWLKQGSHLDLVGAFTLSMRECDDAALRRARVFVDTSAALHEGGDVALAIRDGILREADVVADLHALCRGAPGRNGPEEITVFKSVGTAIEDLAAAVLVWEQLGKR